METELPFQLLVNLLHHQLSNSTTAAITDIRDNLSLILNGFLNHPATCNTMAAWASQIMAKTYAAEVLGLTHKNAGYHFVAYKTSEQKLHEADISDMAGNMLRLAPNLWELLDSLLSADPKLNTECTRRRKPALEKQKGRDGDVEMEDPDDKFWRNVETDGADIFNAADDPPENLESLAEERSNALIKISLVGVFAHSCGTPETLRELLAHMGISILTSTINGAIKSLSQEAGTEMRRLNHTVLSLYAYDNLDIDLKHAAPVLERSEDTLVHLTSATMLPLQHDVTTTDLRCSEELKSILSSNHTTWSNIPLMNLLSIHLEEEHPSGLVQRQQFNCWKFLHDLIHFGPEWFRKFRYQLGDPEIVEGIPVTKTTQVALLHELAYPVHVPL
ncbi:hypothetical protein DXG01_001460 [Tephrocybe rancida]|nr:hypothetical protein DXG01_001460 [Tephrocybe rancida]